MNKNITRRVVAAAGLTGVVAMGLTSLGAGGATAGPLPGGKITKNLVDGTPITVQLFDESVTVTKPLINVPTNREVWASGKVKVTVGGKAEGGEIEAGYIVGCQVHIGAEGQAGGGIGYSGTIDDPAGGTLGWDSDDGYGTPGVGAGFEIGPGQVTYVPIIQEENDDDDAVNSYTFGGSSGGVAYSQEQFTIDRCAGFAEAKAKVTVTVETDAVKGIVTLYGKPFSLG
ncbi:MspA family porin [Gordonia sp. NPDC057258]|uniref:MspA family porin n=1 Tax=unclassified Gordonia (in: high G+C Gram-positive bacteria) TaxID=2657482 RepID=UPI00362623E8